jgi:serine/threonine protein kinase
MRVVVGGRYEVISRLGQGQFGVVVKCKSLLANKFVAAKIEPTSQQMLKREASIYRLLRGLKNIPTLLSYGQEGPYSYMILPFLGQPLVNAPIGTLVSVAKTLIGVLQEVHGRGIVHCDVKPDNILLSDQGIPFLIDFGLARFGPAPSEKMQSVVGSAAYCSRRVSLLAAPIEPDDLESLSLAILACAGLYIPGRAPSRELDIASLVLHGGGDLLDCLASNDHSNLYWETEQKLINLLTTSTN